MSERLPDDCFALPQGIDWTPVNEALARLRAAVRPVTAFEDVDIWDAGGRFLALPVAARRANPPEDNSAVDGYAFAWASLAPASPSTLPLVPGRAAAGHPAPVPVPPGHAIRILTGAAMPTGTDTVVLDEDVEFATNGSGGAIRFPHPRKQGANRRKAGEDAAEGEALFPAGRRLAPQDLARAAVTGVERVSVHLPLRVAVLSTGDELIEPGSDPDAPGVFDANRPMLLGLIRALGHEPVDLGAARDDAAAVREAFEEGASLADAILTSGGASAGDEDHISRTLREEGSLQTWRIAVKPGRPLAMGQWKGVPVFGLPGNPVAAFVCALVFARPALAVLAGGDWAEPRGYPLPAAFTKRKKPGRREFLRARIGADGRVEAFHSEGSGLVGGLSWADGLVELPDGALEIVEGDPVRFIPWSSFGL